MAIAQLGMSTTEQIAAKVCLDWCIGRVLSSQWFFCVLAISLMPSVMQCDENLCCCNENVCYCCKKRARAHTHRHKHSHKPVHSDVNECATNNGGCHSNRKCTNTVGSFSCGDCPAGYTNDGAKGCKGLCEWMHQACVV